MSTKIYYGYKIDINSIIELEQFRKELVVDAKKMRCRIAAKLMLFSAVGTLDLYQVGFNVPKKEDIVFGHGYHYINEKLRNFKNENKKDPIHDLRFEVVIFLNTPMLAIFIGDNANMRDVFANHPKVEYYGYWNNTDGPEDASEEDWKKRKEDWEFLEGAICDNGVIISVSDHLNFRFVKEEFSKNDLPNWDERCKIAARNIILNRVDKGLIDIPGKTGDIRQDANIIYNWCYKGDGVAFVDEEIKEVENILIKNLEYEDIFELKFIDHPQIIRIPK